MINQKLNLEVFKGEDASVNSFLFSNARSSFLVDAMRSSKDARKLVPEIQAKELPLTHILITHGHPDHYLGIGVLCAAFPAVQVVVATPEIKADIISFTHWMESFGWLEDEPAMKPRSTENPNGFDYEGVIGILEEKSLSLEGGGSLLVETDYRAAEANHHTTLYAPELNVFLSSDLCYNGVHLWLGDGVDKAHIANWKAELKQLKERFKEGDITIYPGHGSPGGVEICDTVLEYIASFENTIAAASSEEEALEQMKSKYPNWEQDHFLLPFSVRYHFSLKK